MYSNDFISNKPESLTLVYLVTASIFGSDPLQEKKGYVLTLHIM